MIPHLSKLQCPMKVLIFVLYTFSFLTCLKALSSNDWFVITSGNRTFQIGLNDNCIVEAGQKTEIKCARWNEPEKFQNIFPVNPIPSSTLVLLNRIKWVPLSFVLICMLVCIIALSWLRSTLVEIFKGKVAIITFLVTGALFYIWILALIYYIYFRADALFDFTIVLHEIEIGNAIGNYWISFVFYMTAILLYIIMMMSTCTETSSHATMVEMAHLRASNE